MIHEDDLQGVIFKQLLWFLDLLGGEGGRGMHSLIMLVGLNSNRWSLNELKALHILN